MSSKKADFIANFQILVRYFGLNVHHVGFLNILKTPGSGGIRTHASEETGA